MRHAQIVLPLVLFAGSVAAQAAADSHRQAARGALTIESRLAAQRAIEDVYWRHRIWPDANPTPKPSLDAVMPASVMRATVDDYLRQSTALQARWGRQVSREQLQAELDRMTRDSRDRVVLAELLAALGDDPVLIAECLARPILSGRLLRRWYAFDARIHAATRARAEAGLARWRAGEDPRRVGGDFETLETTRENGDDAVPGWIGTLPVHTTSGLIEEAGAFVAARPLSRDANGVRFEMVRWSKRAFDDWWIDARSEFPATVDPQTASYVVPTAAGSCAEDAWTTLPGFSPDGRSFAPAVWTGSEMIVWGGNVKGTFPATGGRYDPATDSWRPTNTANAPVGRQGHTAVWTGTELIVWGGTDTASQKLATGGRYDPTLDTWTSTPTIGAPAARDGHTAVWTGSTMIVWGGQIASGATATGARYAPAAGTWSATRTMQAPAARDSHTAIWTGSEMIVWGGVSSTGTAIATGGRYDPSLDSWNATKTVNAPSAR